MKKVGDKSKAICHVCVKIVNTTIHRREVESLPVQHGKSRHRLVGVCDECNTTVSVVGIGVKNAKN